MKKDLCKYLSMILCLFFLLGVMCSCASSNEKHHGEADASTENFSAQEDGKRESKSLKVYENGTHTFSIWDSNKNNETMTFVFDGDKVIKSYYVFEETNDENTVTLYNGSDADYKWKIQISYNNVEDTYSVLLGDDENVLLFADTDFSGCYSFKEEKMVVLDTSKLDNPLSFEVQKRKNSNSITDSYKSRANGNWHHSVNKTDTQTLMIYAEEIFVLNYISVGQVKETVKGTYTIISDDGKYQEFLFVNADDATQKWTAKIWQTELKDESGVAYDGIVYINSSNETMYYTGTKW